MPRTVNPDLVGALAGDSFQIAHLIFLNIGGGIYITDNAYDVSYVDTYTASDHLIEIGSPTETRDLRVNTLNIGLSGVDQAYISLFLQSDWLNRQARVQKVVIDGSSVVGAPLTVFEGQITRFQISESDRGSDITVAIASHWADFDRKAGRLTNNVTQQYFFPNDIGFEYSANTVKDIKWGRK
jgi:hypothetical protein